MNKKVYLFIILLSMFVGKGHGAVTFLIKHHEAANGTQVTVPVRVKDFTDIISSQGTIQFAPAIVSFVSVQDFGLPGMNASNFGTTLTSSGKLTFSWSDNGLIGRNMADSAVLFSIRFNVNGSAGQQTTLALINSPTAIEVVNSSFQTVATTLVNGAILVNNTPSVGAITLYADTISGATGSQASISVRALNFSNINSIQGTIEFDPTVVSYQSISYFGLNGMSASNFGLTQAGSGKITFSWTDPAMAGLDKANGSPLFTILFTLNGNSGSQTNINFSSAPTAIEITDSLFNTLSPTLVSGSVRILGSVSSQFSLKGDSTMGPNGSQVLVPIRAWKFNQMLSIQGTLQFNPSVVTFAGVEQFGLAGMDATNFGTTQTSSGKLMYSWTDGTLAGITKSDSTVLFAVRFNVIGTAGDFSPVEFTGTPTSLENTDISYSPVATIYHSGNINIVSPTTITAQNPTPLTYCSGDAISVSYTKTGILNINNDFILQLSDATGSFSSPVNLDTLHSTTSGIFNTFIPAITTNGTLYRIRVNSTDPAITGDANSLDIIISTLPGIAAKPSGMISVCQDAANTSYSTTGATSATSYSWYVSPTTAGTITGTTTSAVMDWNPAFSGTAYIKVYGKNNSCSGAISDSLAVTVSTNPLAPLKPIGDTILCTNPVNSTYTITPVANATVYSWSLIPSGAGTINGTGTSATVNWNDTYTGVASIQVYGSNGSCDGAASPIRSVTILATPIAPAIPTGITTICQDAADAIYKINKVANATAYTWSISPITAGTISGTDTIGTVNWNAAYSGNAIIYASAQNQVCSSAIFTGLSVTVLPYPATPSTPSGAIDLCINASNSTYTIPTVTNATSYTWTIVPSGAGTMTPSGTSVVVDWTDSWTGIATINVSASNGSCVSSISPNLSVNIRPLPLSPNQPSGVDNLCQNSVNSNYTTSSVTNATSYEWTITPGVAATLSGTGTTVTIDWSSTYSGTATLHVRGLNVTCAGPWSSDLSINVMASPSQATLPTGITDICQNDINQNYTTTGASNATTYQWNIWPLAAGTITGTTTSAVVDWNSTFSGNAYIKVMGKNSSCDGVYSDSLAVLVRAYPLIPVKPDGDTLLCTNPVNSTYTITPVANATVYSWSLLPSGAGTINGTGTSATVNWNDTYTGVASIQVYGSNGSCDGAASPIRFVTILATPSAPAIPTGITTICQDAADAMYKINKVANATAYTWSISPTTAGTITGTDTIGTVIWSAAYSGNATIYASAQNQVCSSAISSGLSITVLPYPATPSTPSGAIDLCINTSNSTYTIPSVTNATSYTWTITPSGAGTITPSGTSVVVDWTDSWSGIATINVSASNGSCTSTISPNLSVNIRPLPLSPYQPSGVGNLCQNAPNSNYSISSIANATSYEWTISPGTAATLSGTDTTVTIDWNSTFTGTATLRVRGLNNTCIGSWSTDLNIDVLPTPLTPIRPIGDSTLCINNSNSNYFTNSVANTTSYLWQLIPSTAGSITSSDTTSEIDWNDAWVGIAKIVVTAQNNCGYGPSSDTLNVKIQDIPGSISTPIGMTDICQSTLSTICTIASGLNTDSYEWILNPLSSGTINPVGATTAEITWSIGWSGTAFISVRGLNSCGVGQWTDSLTIIRHPEVPVPTITQNGGTLYSSASFGNQWYFNGSILNGETNPTYNFAQNGSYTVLVTDQFGCTAISVPFIVNNIKVENYTTEKIIIYPNPSDGEFDIRLSKPDTGNELEIYNALGMRVHSIKNEGQSQTIHLKLNLPKGVYYLKETDKSTFVTKLVIN
jgi:hypothetical protein